MSLRDSLEMVGSGTPGNPQRVVTPEQAALMRRKAAVAEIELKKKEIKLGLRRKPVTLDIGRTTPGFTIPGRR